MILYGGKFVQKCIVAWWCLIRLGFGVELGMLETVNEVLNNFNVPLKITIMTCWDVGTYALKSSVKVDFILLFQETAIIRSVQCFFLIII